MTAKQHRVLIILIVLIGVIFTSLLLSLQTESVAILPTQVELDTSNEDVLSLRPTSYELSGEEEFLIQFGPETSRDHLNQAALELGIELVGEIPTIHAVVARPQIPLDSRDVQQLLPGVVIEPNYQVRSLLTIPTNDPLIDNQWALDAIEIDTYWDYLPDVVDRVTVAVIDSGICFEHEDLQGRILDNGYDYVNDDAIPSDLFGHGCAVSGIIAANSNNNIGVAGVAPHVDILPIRVLDDKGIGSYGDLAAAIYYAVDNDADIINLSLGGQNYSQILEQAVTYALERDIAIVAGAGNSGKLGVYYPARYEGVIAVGSLDMHGDQSDFTSHGPELDTLAPGENILTTSIDGQYSYFTGTSMAVPHITGLMALSDRSNLYLNLDYVVSTPVPDMGGISALNDPTATPTPPSTPDSGLTCEKLFLEDIRFQQNRIIVDIFNEQNAYALFDAFRLEWSTVAGFPDMSLATMSIDSEVKWFGDESSPADISNNELISSYLFNAWESQSIEFQFLSGPSQLSSELTIEDFAGSTLTFNGISHGTGTTCIVQIPEDLVTEEVPTVINEEGFRCHDIQVMDISIDQSLIYIDIRQSAFEVEDFITFTQFEIHYPAISGYPDMYLEGVLLDGFTVWSGDNSTTSPVSFGNLTGLPPNTEVLDYNNSKRITLSFANAPTPLADFMTEADLAGTKITFDNELTEPNSNCVIDVVTNDDIPQCGATYIKYAGMVDNTVQYRVDDVDVALDEITRILTTSTSVSGSLTVNEITIDDHTLWDGPQQGSIDTATDGTFYPYQAIDGETITFHYDFAGNMADYFYPYDFTTGFEFFNLATNSPCDLRFIELVDLLSFPPPDLMIQPISNTIQLDWTYSRPVESFKIERQRLDGVSTWQTLATVAGDARTFNDVTGECDVNYRWKVTAFDDTHISMPSYAPEHISNCNLVTGIQGLISVSPTILVSETLFITVEDSDIAGQTNLPVTVEANGDLETITLDETPADSGIFVGSISTAYGLVSDNLGNGSLNIQVGDTITTTYLDELNGDGLAQDIIGMTNVVAPNVTCSDYPSSYTVGTLSVDLGFDLRQAVECANNSISDNTIDLNNQTVAFNYAPSEYIYIGMNALEAIAPSVDGGSLTIQNGTIERAEHLDTCIADKDDGSQFRLLITQPDSHLILSNITIKNGCAFDHFTGVSNNQNGGAIHNYGNLDVIDSTITLSQTTDFGGGIFNHLSGVVSIVNSTISENSASSGGGISNNRNGNVAITDSFIIKNTSVFFGGGIYNRDDSAMTINTSSINDNITSGSGGGIFNYDDATLIIVGSTIDNNSATEYGGGIGNDYRSNVTIDQTTISNNVAEQGGGIYNKSLQVTVTGSTAIFSNTATDAGGGIYTYRYSETDIINSTIYGNTAQVGGGVALESKEGFSSTITNSTITNNSAAIYGGGVYLGQEVTNTIANSVIANNVSGGDCYLNAIFAGTNIIGDGSCDAVANGQLTGDPLLGSLQDNGGSTMTMALLHNSPAIDVGDNSLIPITITTDQRGTGYPRIQGASVDLGAFEAVSADLIIPILLVPLDGETLADPQPNLQWEAIEGFNQYELQMSRVDATAVDAIDVTDTSYSPTSDLLSTEYEWRVRGINASGEPTQWSSIYSFTVEALQNASPILNIYNTSTPTLTWNRVTWATAYDVHIATDSRFNNIIAVSGTLDASTLSYTPSSLNNNQRYYWRVRARNTDDVWGSWSAVGDFTISY